MPAYLYRWVGNGNRGHIVLSADSEIKGMLTAQRLLERGEAITGSTELGADVDVFALWADGATWGIAMT